MSTLSPNGACFSAKASDSVNWLWHKRLSHRNFKNINKLAKQNKVLGLSSLVYSKDKPFTTCDKGKNHRASFKTKQNFSIRKCLHLLHMDVFGPNDQMITQPTDIPSRNNTEVLGSITKSLVPDVTQSHILKQAFTSSQPVPQDRWSRDQHIELVNIIGDLGEGMLTRSMAAKHTAALTSPLGFESSEFPDYVCKLDKALYGLKQAPRSTTNNQVCSSIKQHEDNVTFQTDNVVGNFNHPPNVPAYKPLMNFLLNCPLKKAFTNCPSVVYQNFLKEFWSNAIAYGSFPSTDETEQRPLMQFLIKFSILNGQRPLTLDFNTFFHHLALIIIMLLAYCIITGTEVEIGEIIYCDLVTKSTRLRYQSLPKNKGKPSHEGELDTQPIVLSKYAYVRAFLLSDDESEEYIIGAGEEIDEEPQVAGIAETHHHSPLPQADKPQSSHALSTEALDINSSCDDILKKYDNTLPLTKRQLVMYLRKVLNAVFTKITEDNWEKHEEPYALKQDEELATWAKSSTNMAWNLGSRLLASRIDKREGMATVSEEDSLKKLVHGSTIVRPDPDALIPYIINEEEEAEKIGLDPKKITSAKAGEKFKKAQDAEH
nr:retrovirus-related Pol polyprotein from transposon TNT 1-94 [Tanacetum cinerariifolium]